MSWMVELTYTGVMVLDVQKVTATSALKATPGVLAAALRTLTSSFFFAFINICQQ